MKRVSAVLSGAILGGLAGLLLAFVLIPTVLGAVGGSDALGVYFLLGAACPLLGAAAGGIAGGRSSG